MLTKQEIEDIQKQVKANRAKLNGCARHRFTNVGDRSKGMMRPDRTRTCEHCGGTMIDENIVLYATGYKAAGGDPADVLVFFDGTTI